MRPAIWPSLPKADNQRRDTSQSTRRECRLSASHHFILSRQYMHNQSPITWRGCVSNGTSVGVCNANRTNVKGWWLSIVSWPWWSRPSRGCNALHRCNRVTSESHCHLDSCDEPIGSLTSAGMSVVATIRHMFQGCIWDAFSFGSPLGLTLAMMSLSLQRASSHISEVRCSCNCDLEDRFGTGAMGTIEHKRFHSHLALSAQRSPFQADKVVFYHHKLFAINPSISASIINSKSAPQIQSTPT